jgi:hypothetical protein
MGLEGLRMLVLGLPSDQGLMDTNKSTLVLRSVYIRTHRYTVTMFLGLDSGFRYRIGLVLCWSPCLRLLGRSRVGVIDGPGRNADSLPYAKVLQ